MKTMKPLSRGELRTRLVLDHQIVMEMASTSRVIGVRAYGSVDPNGRYIDPVSPDRGGEAAYYTVDFHIRTLSGAGTYTDHVKVGIDLLAPGNYPYTEPISWVLSHPLPWNPHFKTGAPICIGKEIWKERKGEVFLGHLINHLAKLLNFDESAREGGYEGWNPEAIAYWQTKLGGRPLDPALKYPAPHPVFTHGRGDRPPIRPAGTKKPPLPAAWKGSRSP